MKVAYLYIYILYYIYYNIYVLFKHDFRRLKFLWRKNFNLKVSI